MKIETNYKAIENEIYDIIRMFFPNCDAEQTKLFVQHKIEDNDDKIVNRCKIEYDDKSEVVETSYAKIKFENELQKKKYYKRYAKLCIYKTLSKILDKNLPWGSLTGIRPTRLAYDLIDEGVDPCFIKETLMENFLVSEDKAKLVDRIIKNQNCIIKNDNLVDLYVNIPICPTRCSYCSFISSQLCDVENIVIDYLDCLIKELNAVKEIIKNKTLIVRTIYVGGGTPTSLNANQLEYLLQHLSFPVSEFTVECGRPETITKEKLEVLKKYNVTRICINPQTFNAKTLKKIGRQHTIQDVLDAYRLALEYDFNINMDLIAGLPGEKFANFKKTIDTCIELFPQNITVHTLSIKNGSLLYGKMENYDNEIKKMLDYSNKKLTEFGYKPYYLYRQKNQLEGLENVGYCQPNSICIFNIDSMEETCSIIACGANAISKKVYHNEKRIEREANVKFIKDYIDRIDEMIERKISLF